MKYDWTDIAFWALSLLMTICFSLSIWTSQESISFKWSLQALAWIPVMMIIIAPVVFLSKED